MSAIFISHSSKDNAIAGEVKAKLLEQGHRSVFLDFDPAVGIPAGHNWEKELYARLRGCQAVIVLCSEHSMASPWCFAEITQARSLGKHLFPLKVVACQISPLLSDVQVTDLILNPAEGYQRLWSGLKKVGLNPMNLFDWDGIRPPYPGLLAFQEQDAAIYFGRDAAIQETMETLNRLQRLGGARLVLVLGASGSGKSSLVRAGIVPRLKRDQDRWLVLEPFRPLERPFDQLAMVLASAFASFDKARDWRSLREALTSAADTASGAHLLDLANDLRVMAGRHEATVLLVVDQFEELLGRDTDPSASLFFRLLKTVLSQPNSPFLAVATLRSDFLGAFQTHEAVQHLLYEPLPLPQMAVADFAQVIEGPAKVAGVELEAGLAQAMVVDTATDDALPLLAFTLRELWDRYSSDGCLTLEEYRDRLGGLQGSLARAAEAICAERRLSADEELHLRKAFLTMVRVDEEGRYVRKPARWTELLENVYGLLERFVQARLLISRSEGAERILEVAHEALFRSWDRLMAWLNADREFLLWRQWLLMALDEWEHTGRDKGALLRRARLAEAERWLAERGDDLSRAAHEFLWASQAEEKDEIERQREEAERYRQLFEEAERQRHNALARQLAAQAELTRNQRADLLSCSVLLAVEAMRRSPSLEADQTLRHGLALLPRPIARLEHEGSVQAIALSPDGRYLATASQDYPVRVWEMISGREVARLEHERVVTAVNIDMSVAFSPNGHYLATASGDSTARVWEATSGREVIRLTHQDLVWAVAFSPDGHYLATASADRTARVWEMTSGREVARLPHEREVRVVTFSPDGTFLATASQDCTARVWEMTSGREVARLEHERVVTAVNIDMGVAFSPDGHYLATASGDHTARVWEATSGREVMRLTHQDLVWAVAFSPDGHYLATASQDCTARVWEAASGHEVTRLPHEREVRVVTFSPDGTFLATASSSMARVWEATRGREVGRLLHDDIVKAVTFSPDGTYLVSASLDHTARVWEPSGYREVARLAHPGKVNAAAFSPDGAYLATASADLWFPQDSVAQLWEPATGQELGCMKHEGRIFAVVFSPDGQYLTTACGDYTARVWEVASSREVGRLLHDDLVWAVTFSPDGAYLATASMDGMARVWEVASGREIARLSHGRNVVAVAFSPAGQYLATASADHTARVWEVASSREVGRLLHDDLVWAVTFSPDGAYLATASMDGMARVWEVASGREIARLSHGRNVVAVAFSSDGRSMATASADSIARVWEATNGREIARLVHERSVKAIVFSPDDQYVATASADHHARVWVAASGREVTRLAHGGTVWTVAFSPNGRYLATASADHTTRVWLWRPEDLIAVACTRLTRNLTLEEWRQYLGDEPYRKTCANVPR